MIIQRRSFLTGLIGLVAAPAVIRTPGLLMPVKSIIRPTDIVGYESYSEISDDEIRYRFRAKQANGLHKLVNWSDIPDIDRKSGVPLVRSGGFSVSAYTPDHWSVGDDIKRLAYTCVDNRKKALA